MWCVYKFWNSNVKLKGPQNSQKRERQKWIFGMQKIKVLLIFDAFPVKRTLTRTKIFESDRNNQ